MGDPEIGSSIEEMKAEQQSFDFSDEAGFNFCRERVLVNTVSFCSLAMIQSDPSSACKASFMLWNPI